MFKKNKISKPQSQIAIIGQPSFAPNLVAEFGHAKYGNICFTQEFVHPLGDPDMTYQLKAMAMTSGRDSWQITMIEGKTRSDSNQPREKSRKSVEFNLKFFAAMQYMANFGVEQGRLGHTLAGQSLEEMETRHFQAFAEREQIIFANDDFPHPTLRGEIVTDGCFDDDAVERANAFYKDDANGKINADVSLDLESRSVMVLPVIALPELSNLGISAEEHLAQKMVYQTDQVAQKDALVKKENDFCNVFYQATEFHNQIKDYKVQDLKAVNKAARLLNKSARNVLNSTDYPDLYEITQQFTQNILGLLHLAKANYLLGVDRNNPIHNEKTCKEAFGLIDKLGQYFPELESSIDVEALKIQILEGEFNPSVEFDEKISTQKIALMDAFAQSFFNYCRTNVANFVNIEENLFKQIIKIKLNKTAPHKNEQHNSIATMICFPDVVRDLAKYDNWAVRCCLAKNAILVNFPDVVRDLAKDDTYSVRCCLAKNAILANFPDVVRDLAKDDNVRVCCAIKENKAVLKTYSPVSAAVLK